MAIRNQRYRLGFRVWLVLGALLPLLFLQLRGAASELLTLDPKIRTGRLDNGLTYFLRENHKPENRASLRLVVNAGSILEEDDQQGLAHFLEHMAFNGTEHFEKLELVDFLEGIGMQFGPDLNAYTSFDETVYMLEIPLDNAEVVDKAFLVLQDWARGLTLDPEEIDKERGVVIEEWRLGRGAQQRIMDAQIPILFHESQYADRLPIGKTNVIGTAPTSAFRRFYTDWYRPDLMAVVVVGDLSLDRMESLVRKYFEPLPNPADAPERRTFQIPDHEETLFSIETDPELRYGQIQIAYKREVKPEKIESDYRETLVEGLTTGMMNQRLAEKLQEADPPYLYAGVGKMGLSRAKEVFVLQAVVREGVFDRGLSTLLIEARRVLQDGFTEGELSRAKAEMLRGYEQAYNERDKTQSSGYADEYKRHFLEGEPVPGIEKETAMAREFLAGIDLAEADRTAREWFAESNRVVLYSAPEKPGFEPPSEAEILAMIDAVEEAELEAYADNVGEGPLLAAMPVAGEVVKRAGYDAIGVTEWVLSNGVRVFLKPTDFKNDQVLLRGFSPGGLSLVSEDDLVAAETAMSIVGQSGMGDFDLIQLQKKLAGKIAQVNLSIGADDEGISGVASPTDLETLFQLVYLGFTAPRADAPVFESVRVRMAEMINNRANDPSAVFGDRLQEVLYRNHPRQRPLSLESLEAMDREVSLRIFEERFANAADFAFVLVGNFELENIRPLVELYFGGLPAFEAQETAVFNGDEPVRGQERLTVYKGLEQKSTVYLLFTGDAEWTADARYALRSAEGVLGIRLREELREDRGGVYGVRVDSSLSRFPKGSYSSSVRFGCDPTRVDDLIAVVLNEVKRLASEGPREVDLAKVKEQQLRGFEKGVKENSFWVGNLMFRVQNDLNLEDILNYPAQVESITREEVADAAGRYFSLNNLFIAVLDPEQSIERDPDQTAQVNAGGE